MSELQAAAERMREYMKSRTPEESPYRHKGRWCDIQLDIDRDHIAADYLRLTDPTPLTEAVLRDAGFVVVNGSGGLLWSCGQCDVELTGSKIRCWTGGRLMTRCITPRTLGELNQLLDRVNGGGE